MTRCALGSSRGKLSVGTDNDAPPDGSRLVHVTFSSTLVTRFIYCRSTIEPPLGLVAIARNPRTGTHDRAHFASTLQSATRDGCAL
jgi:hypothetical protein